MKTSKEKAQELYWKFSLYTDSEFNEFHHKYTKECALIVVDEIINNDGFTQFDDCLTEYWKEVKLEIEKL